MDKLKLKVGNFEESIDFGAPNSIAAKGSTLNATASKPSS